jgi:hypothetical protein
MLHYAKWKQAYLPTWSCSCRKSVDNIAVITALSGVKMAL